VTAAKLKAEGVRAGVPDLCLPVARKGHTALWIEMKRPGEKPSDAQTWWHEMLRKHGSAVAVCHSAAEAVKTIVGYLR
jgi:hypothetical protein